MLCGLCIEDFEGPFQEVDNEAGVTTKVCPRCYEGLSGKDPEEYVDRVTRGHRLGKLYGQRSSVTVSPYEDYCGFPRQAPARMLTYKDLGWRWRDTRWRMW